MLRDSTKDLTEHELVVDHYRQVLRRCAPT
jgi:isochorismate synthase